MPQIIPGAKADAEGTTFVVWALGNDSVTVEIDGRGRHPLTPIGDGYFRLHVAGVGPGASYGFCVGDGPLLPDLASRLQLDGADGRSVVVASEFPWTDLDWRGVERADQVLYELHVGTFTRDGTWRAAAERLQHLRDVGITLLHVMPVATFKGHFGWGYDTILPYAPFAPYGSPDDMRSFVDAAHAHGIGVILDVVYNHPGIGDVYTRYSPHYFTDAHENEWGESFNFDGAGARGVRDFFVGNAAYWIGEFHLDGLRLDATQALFDDSDTHIIAEICSAARAAAGPRSIYILAENQPQDRRLIVPPSKGGYGVDALTSDDFQHTAHVALTGHNDFYFRDYLGTPQELVSSLKYGFLYQGQRSDMRNAPYGTYNLDTAPEHIVHFLENHDQIANSARGFRLASLASPARIRAMTALLLLGPQTPCLFQGQEFGASNPFQYFLGLDGDEAAAVAEGRRESVSHFAGVEDPEMQRRLPLPSAIETFAGSKLDWSEATRNASVLSLHRDLLRLRKSDRAFSQRTGRRIDGAVIGEAAFVVRFTTDAPEDQRLLLVNLGRDLPMAVAAEPLLAPPPGRRWIPEWSSEHPDYNGSGRRPADPDAFWILSADTALVFSSGPRS